MMSKCERTQRSSLSHRLSLGTALFLTLILLAGCRGLFGPVSGSAGIGDAYFPQLGNGGYDVQKYTLVLEIDPLANDLSAVETIDAQATEFLGALNLDFQGLTVDSVKVNGAPATYARQDHELTVTPATPLPSGSAFSIELRYHGRPEPAASITSPDWIGMVGWLHAANGSIITMNEPNGAARWFAVNDHPRDKAVYRFDIRVPQPWVAVAPGLLRHRTSDQGYDRFVWEMDQPMVSYLASISIDKFAAETTPGPDGLALRSYFAPDVPEAVREKSAVLPEMMEYFTSLFGPYPFEEYGVLLVGPQLCETQQIAEEVQTLSMYCAELFDEQLLAHELAHQWFGDSVSLKDWQDLWMKEGMATYAEWLWYTRDSGLDQLNAQYIKPRLHRSYSVAPGKPNAQDLYSYGEVYEGGALVFHALRLEVGDDAFFRILQTYLQQYRYGNAGAADLIAVAEKVSGRHLKALFDSWLTEKKPPEMPGLAE